MYKLFKCLSPSSYYFLLETAFKATVSVTRKVLIFFGSVVFFNVIKSELWTEAN